MGVPKETPLTKVEEPTREGLVGVVRPDAPDDDTG
jgi:hypothetical protein